MAAHAAAVALCWGPSRSEPPVYGGGAEAVIDIGTLGIVTAQAELQTVEEDAERVDPVQVAATEPPIFEELPSAPFEEAGLEPPAAVASDDVLPGSLGLPAATLRLSMRPSRSAAKEEVPTRTAELGRTSTTPSRERAVARGSLGPVILVERVEPAYPPSLREAGIGGRVVLHVLVDEEGGVVDVRVARSSGQAAFDDSAVAALRRWRFRPRGASFWASVPVTFSPWRTAVSPM